MADERADRTPLGKQIHTICGRPLTETEDVEVVLDHLTQYAHFRLTPRDSALLTAAGVDGQCERSGFAMAMFEEVMVQATMTYEGGSEGTVYDDWARALQVRYPAETAATLLNLEFLNRLIMAGRWEDRPVVEDLLAQAWPTAAGQYVPPKNNPTFEGIDERKRREAPLVCLALAWQLSKAEPAGSQEALEALRINLEALGPIRRHENLEQIVADFTVHVRRAALESHAQPNDARPRAPRKM